jgi:MSHA pilin protein MshC
MPLRRTALGPPCVKSGGLRRSRAAGFTMVELVIVMTLMAILTAVGMSRFADREPFAVQAAADQIVSSLRIAQATALAQRQNIFVAISASPVVLAVCLDAACTQPLNAPGGDAVWLSDAQNLSLSSAVSFNFDGGGAPSFASTLSFTVRSADGAVVSPAIVIEAVSGHVH